MGDIILMGFWLMVSSLGVVLGLGVYALPTIVAIVRKSPNIALVATVNLVLGGLFVPWWIALAMALWSTDRRGDVTVIQTTNIPPAPPPAQLSALPSSQAIERGDWPTYQQQPSLPQRGFTPPSACGDAVPTSQRPAPGQGW